MSDNSIKQQNEKGSTNIRVFIRVRPFNQKQAGDKSCIASFDDKNISIKQRQAKQPHNFVFDKIFQSQSTQNQVYEGVGCEIVKQAFNGINGTIFCYGQTSSGKTHTCIGPDYRDQKLAGILPRLIQQTLAKIEQSPKNIEAKMKISMVQIYNEKIKDLLDSNKSDLKIRSSKKQGIFLQNVTQKYILVEEQAYNYLNIGIGNRSVNATNMNSQSSRSHMVFIITLLIHDIYSGEAKSAKIILVDLAGSQKISKTGAEGKVLEEAKKINTSLTALGKVINALSDGKSAHIPYRDSKLTRLLQQSLGGNSLTNLIVNVSPSAFNQSQTLTSIRFGQRAKSIKNDPVVNKSYTVDQLLVLLKKAQETIQKQNAIIRELQKKKRSGGYGGIVVSVPKMITMHLIDDEEQGSDKSLQCSEKGDESLLAQSSSDLKGSAFSFKSLGMLANSQSKINLQHVAKSKKSMHQQYQENASLDENLLQQEDSSSQIQRTMSDKKQIQKEKLQKKQEKQQILTQKFRQHIETQKLQNIQNIQLGQDKSTNYDKLAAKLKLPKTIMEDDRQNMVSPRQCLGKVGEQLKKPNDCIDWANAQNNLDKIRQNMFQLKIRYMQEKRQNSMKQMIIERKNRIIQKIKNSSAANQIR